MPSSSLTTQAEVNIRISRTSRNKEFFIGAQFCGEWLSVRIVMPDGTNPDWITKLRGERGAKQYLGPDKSRTRKNGWTGRKPDVILIL